MIFLFDIYGLWFPMVWLEWFRQRFRDPNPEAALFVKALMTVLCTAGIAFYLLFLVALCKECKPRSVGYWVPLRLDSGESAIAEAPQRRKPVTRAA
jgi:hypothetical protein